jgi:hypothetical protein
MSVSIFYPTAGAGSTDFEHTQGVASTVWTITHNKGTAPESVHAWSGGSPRNPDVTNPDPNTTNLIFGVAIAGNAVLEFV